MESEGGRGERKRRRRRRTWMAAMKSFLRVTKSKV